MTTGTTEGCLGPWFIPLASCFLKEKVRKLRFLSQIGPASSILEISRAFKIFPMIWKSSGNKCACWGFCVSPDVGTGWDQTGSQLVSHEVSHSLKQRETCGHRTKMLAMDHKPGIKEGSVLYDRKQLNCRVCWNSGMGSSPKLTFRIKPHFKHYSSQHSIYIFNLLS